MREKFGLKFPFKIYKLKLCGDSSLSKGLVWVEDSLLEYKRVGKNVIQESYQHLFGALIIFGQGDNVFKPIGCMKALAEKSV